VVAQNIVHPVRVLTLERGEHVEKLVRAIPLAVRIRERSVDDLLQDQVAARMTIERRRYQNLLERRHIAVQIADNHHLGRALERDDSARPARGAAHQLGRPPDCR
jgi:hypothetical protein